LLPTDSVILDDTVQAVHDCCKHAAGQDIFLLDWHQVLSYDVSFLNIRIVVNSVINLVNKNLPRTALTNMYVSFQLGTILRLLFLMRSII
jgi:hypothetical protein